MIMRKLLKLVSVLVFAMTGQPALAALTPSTSLTCMVTDLVVNATACSGAWDGNDSNQQADVFAELQLLSGGLTGWSVAGKSDDAGFGPFTSNPMTTAGTLTFDSPIAGPFAISLKASNQFSLYYYDASHTSVASLLFNTIGSGVNDQGNAQDLSHASLYVTPIPEPEIFAMMMAGLGLMGFIARRRKQQLAAA
jgi:hypothetical protein